MSRMYRNTIECSKSGPTSLLRHIEPKFLDSILSLSDIGCPISVGETICLMQSLIEGTPAQQRMIEY